MTRLWLIRHGEPEMQRPPRCYGSSDLELSRKGREQMRHVARELQAEPVTVIYASPLSRALESARIVASFAACPVEVVANLREIDFGEFEGLTYHDIAARHPEIYARWMQTPAQVRFPNGESLPEMRTRVLDTLHAILREHDGQTVALLSHGGVNRILLGWALHMPDACLFRIAQDYGAMNLVTLSDGTPHVELMNYQPRGTRSAVAAV
jgi:alpha-ribazole phosphatase